MCIIQVDIVSNKREQRMEFLRTPVWALLFWTPASIFFNYCFYSYSLYLCNSVIPSLICPCVMRNIRFNHIIYQLFMLMFLFCQMILSCHVQVIYLLCFSWHFYLSLFKKSYVSATMSYLVVVITPKIYTFTLWKDFLVFKSKVGNSARITVVLRNWLTLWVCTMFKCFNYMQLNFWM